MKMTVLERVSLLRPETSVYTVEFMYADGGVFFVLGWVIGDKEVCGGVESLGEARR
jgi:hypothetical protein